MKWQKNFRKVPSHISKKLNELESDELVVGCVKSFSKEQIKEGALSHLNININNGVLDYPEAILPPESQGKYCKRNIKGQTIKRKDLPKETYYITIEAPNYGDPYKGTHDVEFERKRYQRDFIAPRYTELKIDCPNNEPNIDKYAIKFQLTEVLNRNSKDFDERLFFCINLLQENVGDCSLAKSTASFEDYISTQQVSWEILPPGSIDETVERIFSNSKPTSQEVEVTRSRISFFYSLDPDEIIRGMSGNNRYIGAKIRDDLVIFENIRYGNALYVMFENWEELSQKSRIELLSGEQIGFERVIHNDNWKTRVRGIINRKLNA